MWNKSLIVIHTALLLICCGDNVQKQAENVFYYNDDIGITSLDPAFAKDQTTIWAVSNLFNGLVQMDDSLRVVPGLAKSYSVSPDGLLYTFNLHNNIHFYQPPGVKLFADSNESRMKASDVVFSLARIADPLTASPGAWIFNDKISKFTVLRKANRVIGYANVEIKDAPPAFHAPNDSTVEIRLKKAFPPFLSLLTMPYCFVVSKKAVETMSDFRSRPVGTGPFMAAYWDEGVKLVLNRNPNYHEFDKGERLPYLDAICASFISNKQTAFMEFVRGRHDFFNSIEGSYKDELLTMNGELRAKYQGKFRMETAPFLNTEFLGFLVDNANQLVKNSPVRLKKFRQAFSYAIDRTQLLKYLRNNIGDVNLDGFIPAGLPKGRTTTKITYDPLKARDLLAEAGFPNGKGLQPITLHTVATYMDMAVFIQKQLSEVGIPLKIDVGQSSALRDAKSKSQLLLFRGSWIADYPDGENYLATFYSGNFSPDGPNYSHFKNEEFDRLYEQALTITDQYKRVELLAKMEDILMEEVPVVVLYYDRSIRLVQNNIENLTTNPMNWLNLKKVKKKASL